MHGSGDKTYRKGDGYVEIIVTESKNEVTLECSKTTDVNVNRKIISLDIVDRNVAFLSELHSYLNIQNVTRIILSHCELTGLPENFDLPNLKLLNISHNKLEDVPSCLENCLKTVEYLDLSYNKLAKFKTEPRCVLSLKYLNLESNLLAEIPKWILQVHPRNMQHFIYNNNKLDNIPELYFWCYTSYHLEKLELRNWYVLKEDFPFLKVIRTLEDLDISNEANFNENVFSDLRILFDRPAWYKNLVKLNMNNLDIALLNENIANIVNLQELSIRGNKLTWLPESMGNLIHLKVLDVSKNFLTYFPISFKNLKSLRILKAAHNRISYFLNLVSLSNLYYLDLYDNTLEEYSLDLCNVTHMDLENNYIDTTTLPSCLNYEEKKVALRLNIGEREDGCKGRPIEEPCDESSSPSSHVASDCDSISSGEFVPNNSMHDVTEESWETEKIIDCSKDCNIPDNDWCGHETPKKIVDKKIQLELPPPDYLFEDAD